MYFKSRISTENVQRVLSTLHYLNVMLQFNFNTVNIYFKALIQYALMGKIRTPQEMLCYFKRNVLISSWWEKEKGRFDVYL